MTKISEKIQGKSNPYFAIAFYNLENLFDTHDDEHTDDDSFLPFSERRWTIKRYRKKLRKLGYTISKIGIKSTRKPPVLVGLAEVENRLVIEDLIDSKFLADKSYDFVHFDSPDERGIDTALLYDTNHFEVINSEVYSVDLFNDSGSRDYTRDILYVNGRLNDEPIHVLVNHWPSRREGVPESEPKRITASNKLIEVIKKIQADDPEAKIMAMGDFNDDPVCASIKQLVHYLDLHNPMEALMSFSRGSLNHRFKWNLFDQILFTTNFFEFAPERHSFSRADVFDKLFLKQFKGKYKGNPFRTYVGRRYQGGYSDHFPVYLLLKRGS